MSCSRAGAGAALRAAALQGKDKSRDIDVDDGEAAYYHHSFDQAQDSNKDNMEGLFYNVNNGYALHLLLSPEPS